MDRDDAADPALGSDEHRPESHKSPICYICEPHTIKPAIGFCKDCLHHLCDECASRENESHKLVTGDDMPNAPISEELKNVKCFDCRTNHPDIVCETHKLTLLCLNCACSTSHVQCQWRQIKQKLGEIDILKDLSGFDEKLTSVANTCVDEKRRTDDILKKADKSKNIAVLGVTELIKLLEAPLKELKLLKDKLCSQAQRDTLRLNEIKDFNAETLSKVQKMKEDMETIKSNDYRAFLALQVAESSIKVLESETTQENMKRPVPEYRFLPNKIFKNMLENVTVAGKLILSTSDEREPPCPTEGSYVEYGLPRKVAVDDNVFAVTDKLRNSIRKFDREGAHSAILLSSCLWDLAVYQDNKIAVTLPKEQQISIYEAKDGKIKVVEDLHLGYQCEGISFFGDTLFVNATNPPGIVVEMTTLQGKYEIKIFK